ncbi:MAG TPA: glycosyltransferase, partial [Candidatus Baltobacteraceae bacterium]|nr:glycosyltransferase [Candidatus Baltobacteraceae bacterium]
LSVVIASKDRAGFLARALDSLAAQEGAPPFEVIVVDNGSQDATAAVVAQRGQSGALALQRLYVGEPNRGKARNAGVAAALGRIVVFVDDDVLLPPRFLAAHADAHVGVFPAVVSGPILNVASYEDRPRPSIANYSRAFFCTCNVSVPRAALLAAGGFDEAFDLYGWEDTELGLRLRRAQLQRIFAWEAYLYHIKPPASETLDVVLGKTVERARMAVRFVRKNPSLRTKLATGVYRANLWRSLLTAPGWILPAYDALARNERAPAPLRRLARAQLLDGAYTNELRRALAVSGD